MSHSPSRSKQHDAETGERAWRELDDDYDRRYGLRMVNAREALEPLVCQIQAYDTLRRKLEKEGGRLDDLNAITRALTETFCLNGLYRSSKVALVDHAGLRSALLDVGDYDIHLDVRQLDTHMPVYYLCRIRRDYWSEYSLIVEDVYRSPGYPMADDRFVRLMSQGREAYYLRLAQFRDAVAALAGEEATRSPRHVDDLLHDLGRHVFQAAWHEDQRVGLLTAEHFTLPRFRHAIELLYLCLSGELCELRSAINESMFRFFEQVYPQPAISTFLSLLTGLDGGALSGIPQKALKQYARLSKAFGRFIETQVTWGAQSLRVPLHKLLFGNLSRLGPVGEALRGRAEFAQAGAQLERTAQGVIDELVTAAPHEPVEHALADRAAG